MTKKASFERVKAALVLSFLTLWISVGEAASDKLYWAGIGFLGEYGKRQQLYPYTAEILAEKKCSEHKRSCASVYAQEVFSGKKLSGRTVVPGLASVGDASLGLALGISYERIAREEIKSSVEGKDLAWINDFMIFGSALVMNLEKNTLVAMFPVALRYSKTSYDPLTSEDEKEIFRSLVEGDTLNISLPLEALRAIEMGQISEESLLRTQVVEVSADEQASKSLKKYTPNLDLDLWSAQVASLFEGYLARESGMTVLPSRVGHVVGGKLKTRLESGDRTIELPEPDIKAKINIEKLVRILRKSSGKVAPSLCHGARATFIFLDVMDTEKMNSSLMDARCTLFPEGSVIDDRATMEKSLMNLMIGVAKSIGNPSQNDKFFKSAAKKQAAEAKKQFESVRKMYQ